MTDLEEFAYNEIKPKQVWIRKEDSRRYIVTTKARSRCPVRTDWTVFNIIAKPVDGDYSDYVIPVGEFIQNFRREE